MPDTGFQDWQQQFSAHLRDPDSHPPPAGIEERRLAIYRRLFINNIEDLLERAYPVSFRVLGAARWSGLVRDFYREHGCHTPYFHRLADEFLAYLQQERAGHECDPGFLAELAHYERVELSVAHHPGSEGPSDADPKGDPLACIPVLSDAASVLAYEYPVHRIGPGFLPEEPGDTPTYLAVFRDRGGQARFLELNPLSARILWYVEQEPATGDALIGRVAADFGLDVTTGLRESARELLAGWLQQGLLAGTRSQS